MEASAATREWLERYYAAVDAKDIDAALDFFASDARLRLAGNDPVRGREAIGRMLGAGLDAVEGTRHQLKRIWEEDGGHVLFEVDVVYDLRDGRTVTVPGAAVCTVSGGRFTDQRLYADLSPVLG